ncbi:hypothetical protein BDV18DRAFT_160459 [Aspergillus unguis]
MKLQYLAGLPIISLVSAEHSFQPEINHANHIFNALHASMRQFGSSVHHNGMSFFLASVPVGTQLYHGNASPDLLEEIGWMAFEPEHAMGFARPPRGREVIQREQQPLTSDDEVISGYLHTYRTSRDLNLVYIDGTSAGKSQIGTLDLQDRVLFNDTIDGGVSQEDNRARSVCEISNNEWDGRIDGLVRMGAGFEIVLCSPERNLLPVRVMPVATDGNRNPGSLFRAITSRFNGIGGERVKVNYDHFVTAYTYDLDLFPGGSQHPRLQHLSVESLQPVREALTDLIGHVNETSVNWQSVADLIVDKYGPVLRDLERGPREHKHRSQKHSTEESKPKGKDKFKSKSKGKDKSNEKSKSKDKSNSKDKPKDEYKHKHHSLNRELTTILTPFASTTKPESVMLCATQFLDPATPTSPLAHQALYAISHRICSTLVDLQGQDNKAIQSSIHELMAYLDWTVWKECRGCKGNEFCAVPMWPHGSVDGYERPRCQRYEEAYADESRNGYWGEIWN